MNDTFKKMFLQSRGFFLSLPPSRRLSLIVILVLTVAGLGVLSFYLGRDEMRPLMAGLTPEDVQSISARLKEKNIPCTVSESKDTILVPVSQIDKARLEVAASGLASGGSVGFELFDKGEIGLTTFREQLNFRRALEGELSRTIRNLSEVKSARVHLVLPPTALFKEDKKEPSASVVLSLHPGRTLNPGQIKGIRSMVSSAVEGLKPERISLLDSNGTLLARPSDESGLGMSNDRLEYQQAIERSFERRIQDLLEPLVGSGKVVAEVSVDVDAVEQIETSEQYNPDRTVVRSEQRSSETRQPDSGGASGLAGARSNLPGGGPDAVGVGGSKFQRTSETINYEMDKTVIRATKPRGSIKKVSAAVVVDGTYKRESGTTGTSGAASYQPRSTEEMERLTGLVKKAIGFEVQRGDQVEVSNIAFQTPEAVSVGVWDNLRDFDWRSLLRPLGLLALAVFAFFWIIRPATRTLMTRGPEVILPPGRTATVSELERALSGKLPGATPAALMEPSIQDGLNLQESAKTLAQGNPQRVLQVMKGWLEEGNR